MFSTMSSRATRVFAAGALIFSLTATTLVGSANAAPLANTAGCSAASQVRTDAMHALHDAWKASSGDLKALKNGHELMSSWRDIKAVVLQAVRDLKDLGLGSECQDENTTTTPVTGSVTTDQTVKDIVDKAIKDMQAVVDAARKLAADTAARAPKDSTASDEPEDSTGAAEPKDSTDGANGDEDKDSHDGNQGHDEDSNVNNEDKSENGNDDHASANSKAKLAKVAKATSLKKSTNVGKTKSTRGNHSHERD